MSPDQNPSTSQAISVPRDPDVDTAESSSREATPSPDTVNIRDEDYPATDKPLLPESKAVRILHENRERAEGQLQPGSAGDAARPYKTGIAPTELPPRGEVRDQDRSP